MENDFKFIAENGLNAVRIPVGWWIASDPNPPKPFVGGALRALDNAFLWAQYVYFLCFVLLHGIIEDKLNSLGSRETKTSFTFTIFLHIIRL